MYGERKYLSPKVHLYHIATHHMITGLNILLVTEVQ